MSVYVSVTELLSLVIPPSAERLPGMALGLEALAKDDVDVDVTVFLLFLVCW